mgnify:CR=1 FL=1
MSEKILLIDGHSILNRAFYGVPDMTSSEGMHTGAIYGFLNILFKVLKEENPEYMAVVFSKEKSTFCLEKIFAEQGNTKYHTRGIERADVSSGRDTGENGNFHGFLEWI